MPSLALHSLPQFSLPRLQQQQPQMLMQLVRAHLWGSSSKGLQQETLRGRLLSPGRAGGRGRMRRQGIQGGAG